MDRTEQARKYVVSLRGRYTWLSMQTGLNAHWIAKFGQGAIKDPAACKVDMLLTHKLKARK